MYNLNGMLISAFLSFSVPTGLPRAQGTFYEKKLNAEIWSENIYQYNAVVENVNGLYLWDRVVLVAFWLYFL